MANALQLEAAWRRASRSALFFVQFCNAHAHELLFRSFRAKFWHRCWIPHYDFPRENNSLAIRHVFMLWPWISALDLERW